MNEKLDGLSSLLDQLLATAKTYVAKGQGMAEQKLNIPEEGEEREVMLDGMKKGALASAVLVGLLGTKTGRSLTGTAIKLGGLAALGTAAYKGYRHWTQADGLQDSSEVGAALHELPSATHAGERSLLVIKALVAAAHADGHIDDREIQTIRSELIEMHLPEGQAADIEAILSAPMSAKLLAEEVLDKQAASEVYLATRLIINQQSSAQEQGYLEDLLRELDISKELQLALDSQIA